MHLCLFNSYRQHHKQGNNIKYKQCGLTVQFNVIRNLPFSLPLIRKEGAAVVLQVVPPVFIELYRHTSHPLALLL